MNKLIIVRAGSTAWEENSGNGEEDISNPQENRRLQGTVPLPLSKYDIESLQSIALLIQQEGAEVIYSSGNESSGVTAKYLADICSLKCKQIPLLREVDCGLWQGLRMKEIKTRYERAYKQWRSDPLSVCPPQGERMMDAAKRAAEALIKLHKKNRNKTVIVVAAPLMGAIIECLITNTPFLGIINSGLPESQPDGWHDDYIKSLERLWFFADNPDPLRVFGKHPVQTVEIGVLPDKMKPSRRKRISSS